MPQLVPIIEALDAVAKERSTNEKVAIIDNNKLVHKAHMDIHFGFSINGVASIHTDILKNTELHDFYKLYPTHFNNKTNGITFRRWLLSCNEELTDLIDSLIGEGYKQDASELEKLQKYLDDEAVLNKLLTIKQEKKTQLANVIKEKEGIELDPSSIFDVQVKRLHEYKRQQMNVLYIIYQYLQIKAGHKPAHTITCIFGAKADTVIDHYAKGDYYPQDILNNDPELRTLVDFIVSDEMKSVGDVESLERLHNDMSYKDWFMALLDARDYIETKVRAINDYKDRKAWAKKMLVNISKAGFFSSDRTIAQYNEDIWKLK